MTTFDYDLLIRKNQFNVTKVNELYYEMKRKRIRRGTNTFLYIINNRDQISIDIYEDIKFSKNITSISIYNRLMLMYSNNITMLTDIYENMREKKIFIDKNIYKNMIYAYINNNRIDLLDKLWDILYQNGCYHIYFIQEYKKHLNTKKYYDKVIFMYDYFMNRHKISEIMACVMIKAFWLWTT